MAEFIRSRIVQRQVTATEVLTEDLPVNALSHLIITLTGQNIADQATLAEMLAFINNVQVTDNGVGVWDLQSEDLYAMNAYLFGRLPELTGRIILATQFQSLTMIVPFGRRIMDPEECYPARKKGELTLRVDTTIPAGSMQNSLISIDAVELPGASPAKHLKVYRKLVVAPGALGQSDVEMSTGNEVICYQLRMVTMPGAASNVHGVENAQVLVENKQLGYTAADMVCLCGERALRLGVPDLTIPAQGLSTLHLIAWLDYDPLKDGRYLLDTAGKSSVKVRLDYGVNEAVNLTACELEKV